MDTSAQMRITVFGPRGFIEVEHVTAALLGHDENEDSDSPWTIDIAMVQGQMMQMRFKSELEAVGALKHLNDAKRTLLSQPTETIHT